jgi:hypothetical protein
MDWFTLYGHNDGMKPKLMAMTALLVVALVLYVLGGFMILSFCGFLAPPVMCLYFTVRDLSRLTLKRQSPVNPYHVACVLASIAGMVVWTALGRSTVGFGLPGNDPVPVWWFSGYAYFYSFVGVPVGLIVAAYYARKFGSKIEVVGCNAVTHEVEQLPARKLYAPFPWVSAVIMMLLALALPLQDLARKSINEKLYPAAGAAEHPADVRLESN